MVTDADAGRRRRRSRLEDLKRPASAVITTEAEIAIGRTVNDLSPTSQPVSRAYGRGRGRRRRVGSSKWGSRSSHRLRLGRTVAEPCCPTSVARRSPNALPHDPVRIFFVIVLTAVTPLPHRRQWKPFMPEPVGSSGRGTGGSSSSSSLEPSGARLMERSRRTLAGWRWSGGGGEPRHHRLVQYYASSSRRYQLLPDIRIDCRSTSKSPCRWGSPSSRSGVVVRDRRTGDVEPSTCWFRCLPGVLPPTGGGPSSARRVHSQMYTRGPRRADAGGTADRRRPLQEGRGRHPGGSDRRPHVRQPGTVQCLEVLVGVYGTPCRSTPTSPDTRTCDGVATQFKFPDNFDNYSALSIRTSDAGMT